MRRVQVLTADPEILTVQPFTSQGSKLYTDIGSSKVACGMEVTYTVNFCPESQEYYKSELIVVTDREKFIIPVRCFGPKAVLSFPDEINFPDTPINYSHKKNVMIHNMGNKKAILILKTNGAFTVSPSEGAIGGGCFFQCVLEFLPSAIGPHDGELELFDSETGEYLFSKLIGSGSELNVGLSSNLVSAVPTFISRSSQMHIRIINESSAVAHFIWPKFATHTDMVEYHGRAGSLTTSLAWEDSKILSEEYGPQALTQMDMNSNISFQSIMEKAFSIIPIQGEIWPGGSAEIMITFSPQKPLRYLCVADCIVSGKSEPLRLQLEGLGIGPQVCFFPSLLDLGDLKLFSVLSLKVKVKNTGELEALYRLMRCAKSSVLSFDFTPRAGKIQPGESDTISVKATCESIGSFDEEILWEVEDAIDNFPLRFRGSVSSPAFELDVWKLDFGLVSYGLECCQEMKLKSGCPVALHCQFRLLSDEDSAAEYEVSPNLFILQPVVSFYAIEEHDFLMHAIL